MTAPTPSTRMPAAFLGHGNPMNALENNRYTQAWRAFGRAVPKPRAVLVVSAHWYINATAVTAMPRPRTIHDVVEPTWVGADLDSWGIDHGTWSVLVHAFPDADVPVVQLSITADQGFDCRLELGAKLAPLRDRGVLVLGSGNVVHNLGGMDWSQPDGGYDWAQRFDSDAKAAILDDPANAARLDAHRDFRTAVPTPDHFLPLLYLAGLAGASGGGADVLVDGYAYGSLSMTAYTLDLPCPDAGNGSGGAAAMPRDVPPENSNI